MKWKKNEWKGYASELFDPIFTFKTMVDKKVLRAIKIVCVLTGVLSFSVGTILHSGSGISAMDFTRDMLGDYITVLALFVSFTMGYLSIMITSSSENISELKDTESKTFYGKDGQYYSLYQILTTEITYAVMIEIAFLMICIFEKCIINYLPGIMLKAICSIDIAFFVYVLIVLLLIIKNIYFSFWKSR